MTIASPVDLAHRRHSGLLLLAALTGGLAVTFLVLVLGRGRASADTYCSIYWTGRVSNAWNVKANWSPSDGGLRSTRVPDPSDTVCMSSAPNRAAATLTTSATILSLRWPATATVTPSLSIDGGTLQTTSTNDLSQVETLRLDGTLAGSGTLLVSGATDIAGGSLLGPERLSTRGPSTVEQGAAFTLGSNASWENLAVVSLGAGSSVSDAGSRNSAFVNDVGASVTATGTQAAPTTVLNPGSLINHGTIAVDAGTLRLRPATATSDGILTAASDATIQAAGSWSLGGGSTSGAGTMQFQGTILLEGITTMALPLQMSGTLVLDQPVRMSSLLTVQDGDSGLTVEGSAALTVTDRFESASDFLLTGSSTLITQGDSFLDEFSYDVMQGTATWENAGVLTLGIDVNVSDENYLNDDPAATRFVNDRGATVTNTAGERIIEYGQLAPGVLINHGRLVAVSGNLYLTPQSHSQASLSDGALTAGRGTSVGLNGSWSLTGGTAAGTGELDLSGTTQLAGITAVTTPVVETGTLRVDDPVTVASLVELPSRSNVIDGDSTLTVTDAFTTNTTNHTTLSGGVTVVTNGLSTVGSDSVIGLASHSTWQNTGTLRLRENSRIGGVTSSGTFVNKTGATTSYDGADTGSDRPSVATLQPGTLVNHGVLTVTAGTFRLAPNASGVSDARLQASPGASLVLAGPWSLTGGAINGGNNAAAGGTLTVSGTTTLDGVNDISLPTTLTGTLDVEKATHVYDLDQRPTATIDGDAILVVFGYTAGGGSLRGDVALFTDGDAYIRGALTLFDDASLFNQEYLVLEQGASVQGVGGNTSFYNDKRALVRSSAGATAIEVGRLTNVGSISVTGGTLTLSNLSNLSGHVLTGGSYTANNATLVLGDTVTTNDAVLHLGSGGLFASSGTTNALAGLQDNEKLLDLDPGALTVASFHQDGAGAVDVTITGPATPGSDYGQLSVTGTATLDGTLMVRTPNGYLPPVGTVFRVLHTGQRTGTFARVLAARLADRHYRVDYDASGVTLTVVAGA